MELLFVVMGAALLGAVPRYVLPNRDTYGSALLPATSAAAAAAVWAALTWIGFKFDGGWIWWVSLGTGVVVAFALPLLLSPRRKRHDNQLFERLLRS